MPSRTEPTMNASGGRVRLKAHYGGDILITSVEASMTFLNLCEEVRDMCGLHKDHPLTLKWVDSEGDPCTVSSQMELEEAFRLACQGRDEVLIIHVFASAPEQPGMPCPGEDMLDARLPWKQLVKMPVTSLIIEFQRQVESSRGCQLRLKEERQPTLSPGLIAVQHVLAPEEL